MRNELLAALPASDRQRWLPQLQCVDLRNAQVLYEGGSRPEFVYFPITAVISLMSLTRDGASSELAVVGHEGMAGIAVLMGGGVMFSQAVVQAPGQAYRLRAATLQAEIQRPGPGLNMLLRYMQAVMAHVAQGALCNRYHSIDQQLCRRLLLGLDRSQSNDLEMTQEGAAYLLGVRREGVTAAALKLQRAGVIDYHRGRIRVLDRHGLEHRACECYAKATSEHRRLLPPLLSSRPAPPSNRAPQRPSHYGLSLVT
jgi:CRP-like cAMP-binding protein